MTHPTIKKFTALLKYTTGQGSRATVNLRGGDGSVNLSTGEPVTAEFALVETIGELVRIALIAGLAKEVQAEVLATQERVQAWQKEKANG